MTWDRDERLMSKVALGRQEALESLIRRHANPLLTFIRCMITDHHRSEDLFQDVFVAVWRKRKQFDASRQFRPWLFAIALNLCRAEFRRRRLDVLPFQEETAVLPMGTQEGPGEIAIAVERATLVLAAVQQLPVKQRTVVVMRTWSGLSFAEIAEAVGRREGTVRAQMHQALTRLREYLTPRLNEASRSDQEMRR